MANTSRRHRKITPAQFDAIRALRGTLKYGDRAKLAKQYGVSAALITYIVLHNRRSSVERIEEVDP